MALTPILAQSRALEFNADSGFQGNMLVHRVLNRPAELRNQIVALLCADFSRRTHLLLGEANSIDLFFES